jgi:DNA-binding NtrC family response regulator
LANVLEHAVILSDGDRICAEDLPDSILRSSGRSGGTASESSQVSFGEGTRTLREMEDQMIQHVLDKHDGDKPAAAKELGIALKTLYNRLGQLESRREAG